MNAVKLQNVTVIYGAGTPFEKKALDNINIEFASDRVTGIIGHTGSGKSTLSLLLNGLLKPTEGKVFINGEDIHANPKQIRKYRFKVGLVFQYPEYQLFEETVYKDIAFGPKNMGLSEEETDARVRTAAKFCDISDSLLMKSPFDISGGQKRRAAIAGVMAMEPDILVLDEPTAGLDPSGRAEILGGLVQYRKTRHASLILISHSMEDIAEYADDILVIKGGKEFLYGSINEVFSNAERLFDAGLDVPQITKLFVELKKRGLTDSTDVYTVKWAAGLLAEKLKLKLP